MSRRARLLGTVIVLVVCATAGTVGGARAATLVTGAQIVDGSVTGRDLRDGGLTSVDVADGGLTAADFPFASRGPQGPPGAAGPPGLPALDQLHFAVSPSTAVQPGQVRLAVATCDAGYVALGGGVRSAHGAPLHVLDSSPAGTSVLARRSWVGRARNPHGTPADLTTWAVCAEVRP